MNSFEALQANNEIRHHENNIASWRFRERLHGEDWASAIAWAQAKIAAIKARM